VSDRSPKLPFFFFASISKVIVHRQLLGRPAKAERLLGWKRQVDFDSLVKEMVESDLNASRSLVEDHN
jgi:GDP-D-mannose dehydratase